MAPIIAYGVCKNRFVLMYGLNGLVEGRDGICCRDIPTNNSGLFLCMLFVRNHLGSDVLVIVSETSTAKH